MSSQFVSPSRSLNRFEVFFGLEQSDLMFLFFLLITLNTWIKIEVLKPLSFLLTGITGGLMIFLKLKFRRGIEVSSFKTVLKKISIFLSYKKRELAYLKSKKTNLIQR